jgi:uracil-DNA glycosylase
MGRRGLLISIKVTGVRILRCHRQPNDDARVSRRGSVSPPLPRPASQYFIRHDRGRRPVAKRLRRRSRACAADDNNRIEVTGVEGRLLSVRREARSAEPYHTLETLLKAVRSCRTCEAHLPLGPRPVLQASGTARILVVGQAPGLRVHTTGIPWNDPSGERLRTWMGIDRDLFYDESRIAIIPMGFCYPGRGDGGDMPPRRECAALWFEQLLQWLPRIELTLLIGQYAQRHFLGGRRKSSLAATVEAWQEYAPKQIPLPHPSPRNQPWFKRHPWFERELVPALRTRIAALSAR